MTLLYCLYKGRAWFIFLSHAQHVYLISSKASHARRWKRENAVLVAVGGKGLRSYEGEAMGRLINKTFN